jgi:hypothetical protein
MSRCASQTMRLSSIVSPPLLELGDPLAEVFAPAELGAEEEKLSSATLISTLEARFSYSEDAAAQCGPPEREVARLAFVQHGQPQKPRRRLRQARVVSAVYRGVGETQQEQYAGPHRRADVLQRYCNRAGTS